VPYDVFQYFGELFNSLQTNALDYVIPLEKLKPVSDERITDQRALYFGVSSDLFSQNLTDCLLIFLNIMAVEFLILIFSKRALNIKKIHLLISNERLNIYWGLIVSNMVNLILPWRFSMGGGVRTFGSRVNLSAQLLIFFFFALLIVFSFLHELQSAKKRKKKHVFKITLRNWWNYY
jgi:hypothetical protein